jgi:hypothetical protein
MAGSRPPDISERVIIDLSGRISTYFDPTTYKYDVAIGGMPFIYAITDNTPYRRQTAEFRTQRVDQLRDPGEQSLSGSGYWIRSQSSFHLGAGATYQEPIIGTLEEARFRFYDSVGINPWTPGEISLLRRTSLQEAATGDSRVFNTVIAGVEYLILVKYASTEAARVVRIRVSDLTETTILTNTDITESIIAVTMGGNDLMMVTPTKVWRYSFDATSPAIHQDYAINTADAVHGTIGYVKNRFILAYHDTANNTFVYELNKNTGSSINLSTLTAVNGSSTLPTAYTFRAVAESGAAIYVGGFSGNQGSVFKITVANDGTLNTMTTVISLPNDEQITGLLGYLGTYVILGTSQGLRVAIANEVGDLSYGPLVFKTSLGVYKMSATGSYIYAGVDSGISGYSGIYRVDLGQPLQNGGYAYATDVYSEGSTGKVEGVALTTTGRLAFCVNGDGLFIEHATELVESGELTTGIIRYETLENKAWKRIKLRTEGTLQGDIDIFRVDNGVDSAFRTVVQGSTEDYDYDLSSIYEDVNVEAQFKFRLNRNDADATIGAAVYGYSVKALPTPTRARVVQFPVFCFDSERDRHKNLMGFQGYALGRLQSLEQLEAEGKTIIIQDFTADGEPTEAVIEQVTFTRTSPPNGNFSGYGGILQITARTVV